MFLCCVVCVCVWGGEVGAGATTAMWCLDSHLTGPRGRS